MRKMKKFNIALFCAVGVAALAMVMSLPVFNIKDINVTGLGRLTKDEVLKSASLAANSNFFLFSSLKAKKELTKNPYIESVEIVKVFPNLVSLHVNERKVCGYVQDTGNFIYIDKDGRVLDVKESFTERLPVIVGLKYLSYSKGEILKVESTSAFNTVVLLANLFGAYELEQDIIRVDIKNEDDIRMFIYNIEVKMGNVSEANDKIRYLKAILEQLTDEEKQRGGTLDLNTSYKGEAARFKWLT